MGNGYPKILFFIEGSTPTKEDLEAADACGPGVAFRNASLIDPAGAIEDCDGVAGPAIPENYAEALPDASDSEAIKKRMAKRNPGLAPGLGVEPDEPAEESDEAKQARIDNALARGGKTGAVNERRGDPVLPSARTSQSGGNWESGEAPRPVPGEAAEAEAEAPPAPKRGRRAAAEAE